MRSMLNLSIQMKMCTHPSAYPVADEFHAWSRYNIIMDDEQIRQDSHSQDRDELRSCDPGLRRSHWVYVFWSCLSLRHDLQPDFNRRGGSYHRRRFRSTLALSFCVSLQLMKADSNLTATACTTLPSTTNRTY